MLRKLSVKSRFAHGASQKADHTNAWVPPEPSIHYLHFTIQPGGSIEQPIAANENAFAWVFEGTAGFTTTVCRYDCNG